MASGIEFQQELKLRTIFCIFTQNIVFDSKMFSPGVCAHFEAILSYYESGSEYFCPQFCYIFLSSVLLNIFGLSRPFNSRPCRQRLQLRLAKSNGVGENESGVFFV